MHAFGNLVFALSLVFLAAPVAADGPKTRVAILMFDGVQIIDFAAPYEVFGQAGFEVFTVSERGQSVTTAMDLSVNTDYSLEEAPAADIILVPGGNVHDAMDNEVLLEWIRKQSPRAEHVLSICTGSFILANSGLLDGKSATTFHQQFDAMAENYPAIEIVRDQRWVDNGRIVTSAGLASGIDAALHVVSEVRGIAAARSVAMHLEYDWSPDTGFVRGLMADQYMREPAEPFAFPEGTVIDRVFSLGDEKYWETRFRVESPWTPEQFIDHLRQRAEQDKALKVMALPDPHQVAWQYESERGGRWRTSFDITGIESSKRYELTSKTMRLN